MSAQAQLKLRLADLGVQRLSVFPGESPASLEDIASAVLTAITHLEEGDFEVVTL